jgi:hypothetical protein
MFFYEDILDLECIFGIHYVPRLRHMFDGVSISMEEKNNDQCKIGRGLGNMLEEMEIDDNVQNNDGFSDNINGMLNFCDNEV